MQSVHGRRRRPLARLIVRVGSGLALALGLVVAQATAEVGPCACETRSWLASAAPATTSGPALRVVTFNVHSGLGPAMASSAARSVVETNLRAIAASIAAAAPGSEPVDVVGLNEVDFEAARSGGIDQAAFLARELEARTGRRYEVVSGVAWERTAPGREVRLGNAVLTRHPISAREVIHFERAVAEDLPAIAAYDLIGATFRQSRGAVRVTLRPDGFSGDVDVLVTHLDAFSQGDREAQAVRLLRRHVLPGRTTVLMGDFNAVPTPLTRGRLLFEDDLTHDLLTSGELVDARLVLAARAGLDGLEAWATFPADAPRWPLDGVLATPDLDPEHALPIGGAASDHLGLLVRYVSADARPLRAWHDAVRARQLGHLERCDGPQVQLAAIVPAYGEGDRRERRRQLVAASGYRAAAPAR